MGELQRANELKQMRFDHDDNQHETPIAPSESLPDTTAATDNDVSYTTDLINFFLLLLIFCNINQPCVQSD
jgi:hypothetical protein